MTVGWLATGFLPPTNAADWLRRNEETAEDRLKLSAIDDPMEENEAVRISYRMAQNLTRQF